MLITSQEFLQRLEAERRADHRFARFLLVSIVLVAVAHLPLFKWASSQPIAAALVLELIASIVSIGYLTGRYTKRLARRFGILCPGCGVALRGEFGRQVLEVGSCPRCSTKVLYMGVLQHLESYLGKTDGGWKNPGEESWLFYVMRFAGGPIADVAIHSTVGFSEFPLKSPVSAKEIRLELIVMTRLSFGDRNIPALLHDIAMEAIERKRAYLRGEVIGPRGKIFPDSELEAFYVATPAYLPDGFDSLEMPGGEIRGFAWLVPITCQEAEFVTKNGWDKFEELIVQNQPDLLDMSRKTFFSGEEG